MIDNDDLAIYIIAFIEETQIEENSKKTYQNSLSNFYKWIEKTGKAFSEINKMDVIQWRQSIKNLSPLTQSNYINILKMFFKWCEETHRTPNNASFLKIPRKYKGFKKLPLSLEQVKKLLNHIKQDETISGIRNLALIDLLLRTGIRLIEANRMNIEDIQTINDYHVIYIQRKGRTSKDDFIVLSDKTRILIQKYLSELPTIHNNMPLFVSFSRNNYLKRLSVNSMSNIIKTYFREIGINDKHITAHSLRHTAGVMALKNNATEYETQLYLGHQNFATTQIYTRMIEREMKLKNNPSFLTDKLY